MELIHQCYSEDGSININVDLETFTLQVDFESDTGAILPEGIAGTHSFNSFDELNTIYEDIAEKLFQDESYCDEYDNVEQPINLNMLHAIKMKKKEFPNSGALSILEEFLPKVKDKKLDNLAFYWNEGRTEGVIINSTGLNGISEKELTSVIGSSDYGEWLNGTSVTLSLEGERFVDDFYELMDNLDELIAQINDQMYAICAVLEREKCFGLIETADDFRALNVWYDYFSVNFELRKKWAKIMEERK